MSEKTSTQSLAEVLTKTDEQILSNWASLGSLIKNFENVPWQEASEMARVLLRDGNAMDYIEQVRSDFISQKEGKKSNKPVTPKAKKEPSTKSGKPKEQVQNKNEKNKAKVIPMNTSRDRFSMNYKRLLKIAPELVERLEKGEEVYGKSKSTGYMDFNLELIHNNSRGFYLALSQYFKMNGDMVADPDMQVLINTKTQTLEALAFQNQFYYREVYDDIYNPKLVNEKERHSQNSFLEQWLINLDNQGHSIKWVDDNDSTKPVETQTKKPHVDHFPNALVTVLRVESEKNTLGTLRKVLAAHLSGGVELTPLEHFITAERINEITNSSEAKYPTQESLTKQSLEEFDETGKQRNVVQSKEPKEQVQQIDQEPVKPDISFIDSQAIADAKKYVDSFHMLGQVLDEYSKHKSGEKIVYAHVLYFFVERINESPVGLVVPYPTLEDLRRDYQKVLDVRLKHAKLEDSLQKIEESNIHRNNYDKLIQLIPDLEKLINDYGIGLKLKSKHVDLPYDFHLRVVKKMENGSVNLFFFEGEFVGKKLKTHSAMSILFDPKKKEVYALSSMLNDEDRQVYKNPEKLTGADKTEMKEQNEFFGKWMDELIEQGHKINEIIPNESDVIDEFQNADDGKTEKIEKSEIEPSGINETLSNQEIEKTAKHWKKLASLLEQKEGLSKEAAKAKALELKADGKAEDYLIGGIKRTAVATDNQLLKLNFQKLNRLVPIIQALEKSSDRRLIDTNFSPVILINQVDKIDKFNLQFKLVDVKGIIQEWTIKVQKNTEKVQVINYNNPREGGEIEFRNLDTKFGDYLDAKLKENLKLAPLISELLEKYPIAIEWTEGSKEGYIGLQDLQELRSKLKQFGFTNNPNETYIKNKVWFRGYHSSWIRIDVSKKEGDYDPNKMELDDWLETYDANFDWHQFNNELDVKELQKKADQMPTFEVGKVELTKEHKRAGLTQKHINWINKHQQGMIITPVKRMTNNTADFFMDMNIKAQRPGKRISRTGRIYYETRSNRSDMTNAGL